MKFLNRFSTRNTNGQNRRARRRRLRFEAMEPRQLLSATSGAGLFDDGAIDSFSDLLGPSPESAPVEAIAKADYNRDGIVNAADYTVWRDRLGTTTPSLTSADGDVDRVVVSSDYAAWKNSFGANLAMYGIHGPGGGGGKTIEPDEPEYEDKYGPDGDKWGDPWDDGPTGGGDGGGGGLVIPSLHSNPGATHTLYLDFDGHYEWYWATSKDHLTTFDIYTPPYDTDGDRWSLSDDERNEIREIFERVAEDFAPFNVNVTTVDPGGWDGTDTTNTKNILRVAIGGSRHNWYTDDPDSGTIGVAIRGSYNNPLLDNLVFVFSEDMTSPQQVAHVISHEAGHAYGLHHQNDPGSADRRHIMHGAAVPPSPDGRVTWSRGEAENGKTQNDIAKLDKVLGRRPDREGNDFASAGELGSFGSASGVIERHSDVDYFRFSLDSWSEATVSVNVLDVTGLTGNPNRGANLDTRIELYTSAEELIVSFDDPHDLSAEVRETLSPGEYYGTAQK